MSVDDALNGGEPYSSAFKLFRQVQALKHTKELVHIPHIKAGAVISHEQLCLISLSLGTADLDLGPRSHSCELNRIGN
ncbi:hypothetical protein QA640_32705 [Bradyrhizobium sp. CB82]|uniref:hypothetical protein n=1 Tax=Bradyrhizobium sp. CB82 TaxID=3039159 RepID=UPI0024B0F689|nr:hypothetical protein [Bradyrhizobium sp. CB82]WFU39113.1 hypothetical protein QA640_32705 [Bradyrhizobium sp. CB82]